jgi:hypothetical protein
MYIYKQVFIEISDVWIAECFLKHVNTDTIFGLSAVIAS